jgi:hypothetical protein
LSFELRCDTDGSPAEERAAKAHDDEGDDVAYPVHTVILAWGLCLEACHLQPPAPHEEEAPAPPCG